MRLIYFLFLVIANLHLNFAITRQCSLLDTKFGSVCVCTSAYCDYLENPKPKGAKDFAVISSSKGGLRFASAQGQFGEMEKVLIADHKNAYKSKERNIAERNETDFESMTLLVDDTRAFVNFPYPAGRGVLTSANKQTRSVTLDINRSKQYQKIVGFGGAFTGAVSHLLTKLDQDLQDHIYKSYYHKDGIAYNILRSTIGGCDFDLEPWAYNEYPRNDVQLTNFTKLDKRDELKIQQIQRLKQVAVLDNDALKIMAAAWSPPPWMKSNEMWTGYSYLKREYYQTWATYHLKFLELMYAKNMSIWAISTGNEPLNGVIGWLFVRFMSLGWTPREQAIWLSDHLGPTIKNSKYKNVLIFGNDDQRYTYPAWFKTMSRSRNNSLDYLDGLAVHWYWDDVFGPSLIDAAHLDMPNKLLINTESSVGDKPWQTHGPELGSWERAEQYARSYLQDLQHAFNGWIDWNLVLDEHGGPNYVNNTVDAAIIVNTTSPSEFYKQPMYYAIGHFTKFLPAGSIRIDTQMPFYFNVDTVAFQKSDDGGIVVVVFNGDHVPVDIVLNDSVRGSIVINIPARSLHTIVYN